MYEVWEILPQDFIVALYTTSLSNGNLYVAFVFPCIHALNVRGEKAKGCEMKGQLSEENAG